MAPVFEIEMLWDCRYCKRTLNRGLEKHCAGCGHPKDDQDREYMPDNVTVADALEGDKRRRAEAGPDWKCKYCGSLQNPLNPHCTECGVAQGEDAKKAWTAQEETATFDPNTGHETSHEVRAVPVEVPKHEIPPPPRTTTIDPVVKGYRDHARPSPLPKLMRPRWLLETIKWALIVIPSVGALSVVLWLLFRTKIVTANVSAVQWEHAVDIDRYQIFHRSGWDPDALAFDVHDLGRRIHHYDHVKVGEHNEPTNDPYECNCTTVRGRCSKTPVSCTSNKNGTARCSGGDTVCDPDTRSCKTCYRKVDHIVSDYEDQPRYQTWYEWNVWAWAHNRTVKHNGSTLEESWPTTQELDPGYLVSGEKERVAERRATHAVIFSHGKDTWSLHPPACEKFQEFQVGSAWKLKVSAAMGVEDAIPTSASY